MTARTATAERIRESFLAKVTQHLPGMDAVYMDVLPRFMADLAVETAMECGIDGSAEIAAARNLLTAAQRLTSRTEHNAGPLYLRQAVAEYERVLES